MKFVVALTSALRKALRFTAIYGPMRTFSKAAGRLRILPAPPRFGGGSGPGVAIIGCGQFAFATIGYFLSRQRKSRIVACFDTKFEAASTFARYYRADVIAGSVSELLSLEAVHLVYIASNHASHTEYAVEALQAGKQVYVEKPVSVSRQQLRALCIAQRAAKTPLFAGYNRPFSKAVRDLRRASLNSSGPMTLSCFVSGHKIATGHWYREPEEGTRICGNVGHWLDLALHILGWGGLTDKWRIALSWADDQARDDDVAINMVSKNGDLINIVLTARTEPFEGINETINFQRGNVIAKIDDFRRMTVWAEDKISRFRYWPKDVGHREAIGQPFSKLRREWREVERSTLLMIRIAEMVKLGEKSTDFSFSEEWASLGVDSGQAD